MKVSGEEEKDLFLLGGPGAEAHDQVRRYIGLIYEERLLIHLFI